MSIALTGLTKRFGDTPVIHDLSVEIGEGELFVLLGGSGSGKSTLLRLIAGLIPPDSGRIELHGRDVTPLPPQARHTGFVFQNYSVFRHMTVSQNVEFGLRVRRVPAAARRRRGEELLELVGLTGLGARYADQLSGGQLQRVALARALAYEPEVLLLDEPFGALDVKIRSQLRRSLKDIQRQLGVTTVLVTHDQEEAFSVAGRIGVIERGHLIEVGDPEDLYHRPRTGFVATFVGGANVLVGRAERGSIRLGGVTLPMPPGAPEHDEGAPARVLFRPETVLLDSEPFPPEARVHVLGPGRCVERTFAGALQRVLLEVEALRGVRPLAPAPPYGTGAALVEAALPADAGQAGVAPGDEVWVGLKSYHLVSPAGLRILIYAEPSPHAGVAIELGCRLASSVRGPVTLLAVEDPATGGPRLGKASEPWLADLPRLVTRVRPGSVKTEVLGEAREGHYDLVVLPRPVRPGRPFLRPLARRLLYGGVPVLAASNARPAIGRILICTAAGEPGKSDVRLGGRVARLTGAAVTVFHVRHERLSGAAVERADRHLRAAADTMEALAVRVEIRTAVGSPLERILAEASSRDYDLVVVGAPNPRAPHRLAWPELTGRIVAGCGRPVLIVPMTE